MREAGILMAISSLPNNYGVGDFGPQTYKFVDYIDKAKFSIWQILPLNPLGLAAVLVELAEELKALQSQVVHEAAQKVQCEVESVAYEEDKGKNED